MNTRVLKLTVWKWVDAFFSKQLAKVWQQLIQLKEEDGVEKKELVKLLKDMIQLLSEGLNETEQENGTIQHVRGL